MSLAEYRVNIGWEPASLTGGIHGSGKTPCKRPGAGPRVNMSTFSLDTIVARFVKNLSRQHSSRTGSDGGRLAPACHTLHIIVVRYAAVRRSRPVNGVGGTILIVRGLGSCTPDRPSVIFFSSSFLVLNISVRPSLSLALAVRFPVCFSLHPNRF